MARKSSELYYPNMMVRIYLQALEEVMGKNGINALLNLAGLPHLIDNYPPANLNQEFDFADFSALGQALDDMYGPRGGRGLALRAGRAAFAEGLANFGAMVGMGELAFKVIPLQTKLKVGLRAMAETFSKFSDQTTTVEEEDDRYIYIISQDPLSWGRTANRPVGHTAVGIIQEGLRWASGGKNFRVEQISCMSMGHPDSRFAIYKEPID